MKKHLIFILIVLCSCNTKKQFQKTQIDAIYTDKSEVVTIEYLDTILKIPFYSDSFNLYIDSIKLNKEIEINTKKGKFKAAYKPNGTVSIIYDAEQREIPLKLLKKTIQKKDVKINSSSKNESASKESKLPWWWDISWWVLLLVAGFIYAVYRFYK